MANPKPSRGGSGASDRRLLSDTPPPRQVHPAAGSRITEEGTTMISRRTFLGAVGAGVIGAESFGAGPDKGPRKKLAVVTTEWRDRSHAWHMAERFLAGYPVKGRWHRPAIEVVSAYVDQFP